MVMMATTDWRIRMAMFSQGHASHAFVDQPGS
jgi:hypothetical protein